ncbi:MAG: nitrate/nitrite transport system substrate-binding protein [Paracoccaceae bacterium]|jgi:nitrate/nitrite transport system substrate-binding protein
MLVKEGHVAEIDFPWASDGYREPLSDFIDAMTYDGKKPNAYLLQFLITLKGDQKVVRNGVKV